MQTKRNRTHHSLHITALFVLLLLLTAAVIYAQAAFSVTATVETPETSRNADDPAIWIHPTDPSQSVILGTFKNLGVSVFELNGTLHQSFEDDSGMNNVDLRYNFPLGGQKVAIAVATDRNTPRNTLAIYKINATTRMLERVTADPPLDSKSSEVYGTCMYVSPISGKYYAFIVSKDGLVEQWELFDKGTNQVDGTLVRSFELGSIGEGCVADDVHAQLYVGQEDVAIWKYGAEPGDGDVRTAVDYTNDVDAAGNLTKDVEGMALYYKHDNSGYLIASSQGSSEYMIYDRLGDNEFITSFNIVEGNGIDAVSNTDGLDVTNFNLGPEFPHGLLVVHDNANDVLRTNFKYVAWEDIAGGAEPDLAVDTSWDPRLVGLPPVADFAADKTSGGNPLTVDFSDQSAGVRSSWLWDFGDGSSSTEMNPSHTYTQGGQYTVSLKVTNVFGSDEESKVDYINISGDQQAPTAAFSADVTQGPAPLAVNFTNQSSGDFEECLWQFGDGRTSSLCDTPNHVYEEPGSYHVSLTVSNAAGFDKMTKNDYITVTNPPEPEEYLHLPVIMYMK